jgi:putative adenylate-forming enzyme
LNVLNRLLTVYRLNHQFYNWDKTTLRKHQQQRIARILAYARDHSNYYKRTLGRQEQLSLSLVPRMDKTEMMAHFDEINTASLHKDELIQFKIEQERTGELDLYHGRFSVGLSSGTSGNKGLTVLSRKEMEGYSCLLWARSGIPREVMKRRILFALRTNNPAFMTVTKFGVRLVYIDYTQPVDDIVKLINNEELNILAGPPSLLAMIARQQTAITHHIDTLVSYAEVLNDDVRANLEATFGAPVVQIYEGAEGFIASTCCEGNLHLNEDVILVELEEAGDSIGNAQKVVITDLYRTTQPIIRYSLNDIVEIAPNPCRCGSSFRVIKRIHGRTNDIFYLRGPSGKICYLFPDYVQRAIIYASNDILEYQAIQHSIMSIEIRLSIKENADSSVIENAIRNNLCWWADKIKGELGEITFNYDMPKRNPYSKKLIRVMRAF